MRPWHQNRLLRGLGWLVVLLALLGTFAMYHRPDFMMSLADQIWSCF